MCPSVAPRTSKRHGRHGPLLPRMLVCVVSRQGADCADGGVGRMPLLVALSLYSRRCPTLYGHILASGKAASPECLSRARRTGPSISGFFGVAGSSGCRMWPEWWQGGRAPHGAHKVTVGFRHGLLPPSTGFGLGDVAGSTSEVNAMAVGCAWSARDRPEDPGCGLAVAHNHSIILFIDLTLIWMRSSAERFSACSPSMGINCPHHPNSGSAPRVALYVRGGHIRGRCRQRFEAQVGLTRHCARSRNRSSANCFAHDSKVEVPFVKDGFRLGLLSSGAQDHPAYVPGIPTAIIHRPGSWHVRGFGDLFEVRRTPRCPCRPFPRPESRYRTRRPISLNGDYSIPVPIKALACLPHHGAFR